MWNWDDDPSKSSKLFSTSKCRKETLCIVSNANPTSKKDKPMQTWDAMLSCVAIEMGTFEPPNCFARVCSVFCSVLRIKPQGQDFYVSMVNSGYWASDSDFLFSCASEPASTEPRGSVSLQPKQEVNPAHRAKKGSKTRRGKGVRSSSAVLFSQTRRRKWI